MIDPKLLRDDLKGVAAQLKRRGFVLDVVEIESLEQQRKTLQVETERLQNQRNILSKEIGLKKSRGEDVETILSQVGEFGDTLKAQATQLQEIQEALQKHYELMPNLLHESVPDGKNEQDNVVVHVRGEPPQFSFKPQDHVSLAEQLGGMDFEAANKISGARFVILKGGIARLHRALAQFMLDVHTTEHGYQETYVPYLVNAQSLFGTGQLSKFQSGDQFHLQEDDLWLIPTSEVPLTNIIRDSILDVSALPLKVTAHTPCFRREAGSYGKDTRGMIRQHQFDKVELVQVVHPDKSIEALEALTRHAEIILERLQLPYRRVRLCAGDTGFSSAMTNDLEVWLPGQQQYREISSCSNMMAFQARRMQARFRDAASDKPQLLHTLNGSGLAVGRALVAVIENYQQSDGTIAVPAVLQSYMGGLKVISRASI